MARRDVAPCASQDSFGEDAEPYGVLVGGFERTVPSWTDEQQLPPRLMHDWWGSHRCAPAGPD